MKKPLVSIIIPTRNSAQFLEACLKSIKDQTYKNIEIIVVDNHSTDDTLKIAKKFTNKIFTKGPERSTQRNFGAYKACGIYVFFVDSDMELDKSVVSKCVDIINKNKNIKGIVIPEESFGTGFWSKCKALEKKLYLNIPWIESPRFFLKKTFHDIGNFDEKLTGLEDFDIGNRLRLYYPNSIGRSSSFIYHNEQNLSLFKTISKKFYYSQNIFYYQNKYKTEFLKQINLINRYRLLSNNINLLLKNPVISIGFMIMKFFEFLSFAIGTIYYKFKIKK